MAFIFQLPAGSLHSPVTSIDPYHVSRLEGGGWSPIVIGIVLVPKLGVMHLTSGDVMDGGQMLSCYLGLLLLRGICQNMVSGRLKLKAEADGLKMTD